MAKLETKFFEYKEINLDQFGGGITDSYVAADMSKYKTVNNLIISNIGTTTKPTLKLRAGCQ